jgi:hypothetical protein
VKYLFETSAQVFSLKEKITVNAVDVNTTIFKPAHTVTFIKQSPVLKGRLLPSCHRRFQMNRIFF